MNLNVRNSIPVRSIGEGSQKTLMQFCSSMPKKSKIAILCRSLSIESLLAIIPTLRSVKSIYNDLCIHIVVKKDSNLIKIANYIRQIDMIITEDEYISSQYLNIIDLDHAINETEKRSKYFKRVSFISNLIGLGSRLGNDTIKLDIKTTNIYDNFILRNKKIVICTTLFDYKDVFNTYEIQPLIDRIYSKYICDNITIIDSEISSSNIDLINSSDLMIGCDNSLTHLAAALGKNVIMLCESTDARSTYSGSYERLFCISQLNDNSQQKVFSTYLAERIRAISFEEIFKIIDENILLYKKRLAKSSSLDTIIVAGPHDPCDGYGSVTENLCIKLNNIVDTSFHPIRVDNESISSCGNTLTPYINKFEHASAYISCYVPEKNRNEIHDCMLKSNKLCSIMTMIESTYIPSSWPEIINNNYDIMLTPSHFCKDVFMQQNVRIPIHVAPTGVDIDKWPLLNRKPNRPFTFLIYANGSIEHPRKNYIMCINAFNKAFGNRKDVRLIVKTTSDSSKNIISSNANITYISKRANHDELISLLSISDCMLFPSSGEGYGLPVREAMSTGITGLITNWSALKDLCLPDISYWVDPISLMPVSESQMSAFKRIYNYDDNYFGEHARILEAELAETMLDIANNQELCLNKGIAASKMIRSLQSSDVCMSNMINILRDYV